MLFYRGSFLKEVTKSLDGKMERVDEIFYRRGSRGQPVAVHRSHFRKVKTKKRGD